MNLLIGITTFFLFVALACANATEQYSFTPYQQAQFQQLTYELRCLVCQNQNLAESNAPLAIDLRNQIANQIIKNKTNQEIKAFLTQRYGDYILYKPPFSNKTCILWILPFLSLILGIWILFRFSVKCRI
jgi:cytochrome c-type biogenesis protein CcmH